MFYLFAFLFYFQEDFFVYLPTIQLNLNFSHHVLISITPSCHLVVPFPILSYFWIMDVTSHLYEDISLRIFVDST